jgi:hypothetical protein
MICPECGAEMRPDGRPQCWAISKTGEVVATRKWWQYYLCPKCHTEKKENVDAPPQEEKMWDPPKLHEEDEEALPPGFGRCLVCNKVKDAFDFDGWFGDRTTVRRICSDCRAKMERDERTITEAAEKGVCDILRAHAAVLSDDPDRLSTNFLKSIIGDPARKCE